MLQFARSGKRLIVLGDPAGDTASFLKLLIEFHREADLYGYQCVFYQISGHYMMLYHDLGYRFFKMGEEAVVPLDTFTLSGKNMSGLRATFNRFAREGYTFALSEPPHETQLLEAVKEVSDAWLGKKKELGFSLGRFDEGYLSQAPIATLSNKEGKIVAFMSLMPVYEDGWLSVDLMHYSPDSPSGIMDATFIHLFRWAKEKGYHYFNIGIAPLSNVGYAQQAFLSERIAATIVNNIRYIYSFKGLRKFKNKYHPIWEGKYLAYRKNRPLPGTMLIVAHLIRHSHKKAAEAK